MLSEIKLEHRARRFWIIGAMALAVGGLAFAADEVLKPATEKSADAIALFDGTNTSHWEPVGDNGLSLAAIAWVAASAARHTIADLIVKCPLGRSAAPSWSRAMGCRASSFIERATLPT